jgi:ABC-type transporter Mla subunit MlaD
MIGIALELLLGVLLATTIGYCIVLERRLRRFRADESAMRQTIVDLVAATDTAERAIGSLRELVKESDRNLADHLKQAEQTTAELAGQVRAGDEVIARIARIVGTAKGADTALRAAPPAQPAAPAAPAAPSAPAVSPRLADTLAAAQAFADRARQRIGGRAA